MLDELNWKTHRYIVQEDSMDNFAEEGIDAFKFLLNLFIINGFDGEDFYSKFLEKSVVAVSSAIFTITSMAFCMLSTGTYSYFP